MDKDFMLQTQTASSLFHDFAEKTPILDYHCHINPAEIANNRKFDNITQVWLPTSFTQPCQEKSPIKT